MAAAPEPRTQAAAPAWQLRWAPDAAVDGLRAFEYVEDDRANSHPAGQPHITAQGSDYRFVMHMQDRDIMTDRQRQEVRGMRSGGYDLVLLKGETWRITYSMFIPGSLKATTRFTHIMQTKAPGTGTNPMVTMSLQRRNNVPKLELLATTSGVTVGSVDLAPLQNRWIDVEVEMTIGDAPNGRLRWVIRNGASTVIDVTRGGIDNWLTDRVRPKWGIYRSLGDTSGSLQDCHLLIRNMRAYQWSDTPTMPAPVQYEAEDATINRGIREQTYTGWRGTGYVNTDNVTGSYVEWTVNAPYAATASLTIGYANGTTTDRPMDVSVNGTLVANDLSFLNTLAWDQWETRTIVTSLRAGANTIRLSAVTANGGPNLDYLDLRMPPPPGPPGTDYQAENARLSQAVVESTHAGFTGTGFVNFDNVAGSNIEFDVTAAAAGQATVTVRYANGTTSNRPMDVTVNGVLVRDDLAFPGTGAWSTWGTASVTVPLNAGVNPLRLTSAVASGGPNIDKITLS
jgi:hypothetical protein